MQNTDFTTSFTVDQNAKAVFDAISNVRGWWSENIEGDTNRHNSEFIYHYQDVHRSKMKITAFTPNQHIAWHVEDNYFNFNKGDDEWTGTDIIFDIKEKDGKTTLNFTHKGLIPTFECFQLCQDAWTHYIQGSLKDLITTGKGSPTPKESESPSESSEAIPMNSNRQQSGVPAPCIFHRLRIDAAIETVYNAVTTQEGLAGWWTPDTIASQEQGSTATFKFGPTERIDMRVEQLQPYNKVKWVCIDSNQEWIGTTITFELTPHPKGMMLNFYHNNWKAFSDEFASCSYVWALFLRSLKRLCETGKGLPFPDFDK